MMGDVKELTVHLLTRLQQVQARLGQVTAGADALQAPFADLLDSMGLAEFVAVLAEDCGVEATTIEESAGQRFGTVLELAAALARAGIAPATRTESGQALPAPLAPRKERTRAWLSAITLYLPGAVQEAAAIDTVLGRPDGWFAKRTGILQRRLWGKEDPLAGATNAARACLAEARLLHEEVGALLVTSEAPPVLAGLAAAIHHRLELVPDTVALEIGGACTGFLAALWLGKQLLAQVGPVVVVAVEAPSRFLTPGPGRAGEAAALFGDGAAACLLSPRPVSASSLPLGQVVLKVDEIGASLLRVHHEKNGPVEVRMKGPALAGSAVREMARMAQALVQQRGVAASDLAGIVCHGGNGRMPGLLARALGLPPEKVWSATPELGNLGSASLPAAWVNQRSSPTGPTAWVAVGAGLTVAGMLSG
jgi:3-oxoacyl-[acyl-carrier-protein] synthase-3